MHIITDTSALARYITSLKGVPFVTVDTEFMRENTYWPKLCLVQVAGPDDAGAIIDPLADGIDLAPLFDLMADRSILKVFHAARQDIEIFVNLAGEVPVPLFDTQVAAMVMGFGESIAYDALVQKLANQSIDKSSRFTDWSRRPLSEKQLSYALSDVTHLRTVYQRMEKELARSGRAHWVGDEMATLTEKSTYLVEPDEAWRRLKIRTTKPKFLAVLKAVTAWREREAQGRDLPRNRVVRDEALLEIAADPPTSIDKLAQVRGFNRKMAEGPFGSAIIAACKAALESPRETWPSMAKSEPPPASIGPVVELLKVLLKRKCAAHGVAQKLVCNSADLDRLAADDTADIPALKGWRLEVFGEDALRLKHGDLGLVIRDGEVVEFPVGAG
ncbi:MAG: ribonuclease D [Pseudomonadota bacterium]|nr:ribonuclease D [Pseudomonadota bacterium]